MMTIIQAAELRVKWKLKVNPPPCEHLIWNWNGVTMARRTTITALFAGKLLPGS
jgi:hypothetical protein